MSAPLLNNATMVLTKTSSSTGNSVNFYTYDGGSLETISHNTTGNNPDVTYTFEYDQFGNQTGVKVGTVSLVTHTYGANNGNLTNTTYGNGQYVTPLYDNLDRIKSISYNGVEKYTWAYGADGNVGLHNDLVNGVEWRYEYNLGGDGTRVV